MKPRLEKIEYSGWNAIRMSNNVIEIVAPIDIGIRLMRLGFCGEENLLFEKPEDLGSCGGSVFRLFGGHRLWIAPEDPIESYKPDNDPIRFAELDDCIRLTQTHDDIVKEMDLSFPTEDTIRIVHRVQNLSSYEKLISLWPITAFAGGEATFSIPRQAQSNLNACSGIILWPYTKLTDPRLTFQENAIHVRHSRLRVPLKIGLSTLLESQIEATWERGSYRVKKKFARIQGEYPDGGACFECFTDFDVLELESLSPIHSCKSGASLEHLEVWELSRTG